MKKRFIGFTAAAAALVLGVVVVPNNPVSAANGTGIDEYIVYVSDPTPGTTASPTNESGDEELYARQINNDTGAPTGTPIQLTSNSCADLTPTTDVNGTWLLWVRKCGTAVNIFAKRITSYKAPLTMGSTEYNLTTALGGTTPANRWPATYSDDTTGALSQLVFMRKTGTANFDIYSADVTNGGSSGTPTLSNLYRVAKTGPNASTEDCCVSVFDNEGNSVGATPVSFVWASNVNQASKGFDIYYDGYPSNIAADAAPVVQTDISSPADGVLDCAISPAIECYRIVSSAGYDGTPQVGSLVDANGVNNGWIVYRNNTNVWKQSTNNMANPAAPIQVTSAVGNERTPEFFRPIDDTLWPPVEQQGWIMYSQESGSGTNMYDIQMIREDGTGVINVTNTPTVAEYDPTPIIHRN